MNSCHLFHRPGVLPLASLRLMASPLQLTYAFMWQVIRQRNVKLYGKVEEFITMVTQTVPELMTFKQTAQLLLGLRARVRAFDCVCVCVCRDALLLRTKQEEMVAVLHTNLLGTILTCRAALRCMLHTDGAAIVNIGDDFHGLFIH